MIQIDPFEMVLDFHAKHGLPIASSPQMPDRDQWADRLVRIHDELVELALADTPAEAAREMVDVIYATIGAAIEWGIDLRPMFAEVHRANMEKESRIENGKVVIYKPDGWEPPSEEAVSPLYEGVF